MDGKEVKICLTCGFINKPQELMCQNCGNNLLLESADPTQTYKSETNFFGLLLKGDYERKFLPLVVSIVLGILMIIFGFILSSIVIQSTIDFPGWVTLAVYFILATIGSWLIFQALKKIFLGSRRNIITEILIAFFIVIGLFFLFRFIIQEISKDNLIMTTLETTDNTKISQGDNINTAR